MDLDYLCDHSIHSQMYETGMATTASLGGSPTSQIASDPRFSCVARSVSDDRSQSDVVRDLSLTSANGSRPGPCPLSGPVLSAYPTPNEEQVHYVELNHERNEPFLNTFHALIVHTFKNKTD